VSGNISKNKIAVNFLWRFFERCGAQLVTFVVSIILARLLDPETYGTIALVTVFTTILHVFIDSGFGTALIQKKDADDLDFSTVFYFNMSMCLALYAVLFFAAPAISAFYSRPELTAIVRVLGLTLIISGVKGIQQSFVSRHMLFKRFFFATLGGTLGAAAVGIWMAYKGFGVWALVAQNLFNQAVDTVILWITVKWRPKKMFSFQRLKGLFSFGWKILVSALLETGYNELRQLLIGKLYSSADLAYYNKGRQFPNLIVTNVNASINSVLLPVMSSVQDQREQVKAMTRRSICVSTYIMSPLLIGLAVVSKPLIALVLTEKWLPCQPFLCIYCAVYVFFPIHTANLNAIKAMGRSDLFLKLEIIKKVVGLLILIITLRYGALAIAYGMLVSSVICQVINSWPNKKLLNYSYFEQLCDIFANIALAIVMGAIVWCITLLNLNSWLTIIFQIILGAAIYLGGSKLLHLESYLYLMGIISPELKLFFGKEEIT